MNLSQQPGFVRQKSPFRNATIVLRKGLCIFLSPPQLSRCPDEIAQLPLKGFREINVDAARFIEQFAIER